eukprot:jgi/Chlat1/7533/Chrsp62S07039
MAAAMEVDDVEQYIVGTTVDDDNVLFEELLSAVFSRLDAGSLARAACVSRAWNRAATGEELWKPLLEQRWPAFLKDRPAVTATSKQLFGRLISPARADDAATGLNQVLATSMLLTVIYQNCVVLCKFTNGQAEVMMPETAALDPKIEQHCKAGGAQSNMEVMLHAIHLDGSVTCLLHRVAMATQDGMGCVVEKGQQLDFRWRWNCMEQRQGTATQAAAAPAVRAALHVNVNNQQRRFITMRVDMATGVEQSAHPLVTVIPIN